MNGIKISLLIPSHKAGSDFKRMLKSFSKTCEGRRHEVEILVKIDPDDDRNFYAERLTYSGFKWQIIQTPRLKGYNSLHIFYNDLAKISSGDLLWVASDDLFITRAANWVDSIWSTRNTFPDNVYVVHVDIDGKGAGSKNNVIPIMSREMYNRLGHISQSRANDKYVNFIASRIKRIVKVHDVAVLHRFTKLAGGLLPSQIVPFVRNDMKGQIKKNVLPLFKDIRDTSQDPD